MTETIEFGEPTWLSDDEALGLIIKHYELLNDEFGEIDFWVGVRAITIGFAKLSFESWNDHLNAQVPSDISQELISAYYMLRGGINAVKNEIRAKYAPRELSSISDISALMYTQRKLKILFNTEHNGAVTRLLACKLYAHKVDTFDLKCFEAQFGTQVLFEVTALSKENDALANFLSKFQITFPEELKQFYRSSGIIPKTIFAEKGILNTHNDPGNIISESLRSCEFSLNACMRTLRMAQIKLSRTEDDSSKNKQGLKRRKAATKPFKSRRIIRSESEDSETMEKPKDIEIVDVSSISSNDQNEVFSLTTDDSSERKNYGLSSESEQEEKDMDSDETERESEADDSENESMKVHASSFILDEAVESNRKRRRDLESEDDSDIGSFINDNEEIEEEEETNEDDEVAEGEEEEDEVYVLDD